MHSASNLLDLLLTKRGIKNEIEADIFLNPKYERDFHDPFLMKDMERACVRIFEAIESQEKVIIYADYDCDGIPGAVILKDLFDLTSYKNFEIYIPARHSEGYGLNMEAVKQFSSEGVGLIITVDLGITATLEIAQAEADGIDVIVTDHHLPGEVLPKAYAILNPKVDDYPEKMLCGAGVAFKLASAFIKKYGEYFKIKEGSEKWMLDMAGIATLADMVPLVGENRAIAYFGLKVLRKSSRPGLQKLLALINVNQKYLSEDDVGFMIVPKLNAASRMDDPHKAFNLLATKDEVEAGMLAFHLSKLSDERKTIVAGIMREVNKKLEQYEHKEVIVLGSPEWRVGVLGLVAGKIVDQYQKPVFVWGKDERDSIRGSCRSDGSLSVVELMTANKEFFVNFGGHELAGGFTVHNDKIHFLEDALSNSFSQLFKQNIKNDLSFDLETDLSLVAILHWREIDKLSPFGLGNPKPTFLFNGVNVDNLKKFGKNGSGEHIELTFSDSAGHKATAISFFSGVDSFRTTIETNKKVNVLANFDLSRFRGREELRLRVVDIF